MFPTNTQQRFVERVASAVDEWESGPVRKALSVTTDRVNIGKQLLQDNLLDEKRATQLVDMYGGNGTKGHELLRVSALDNLLDTATITTNKGEMVLDSKKMHEAINAMDKSGVWNNILTDNDRVRVRGIAAALRITADSSKDVGTSLQRASAIANLRHPTTFVKGLHTLTVNKGLAYAIANPTIGDWYFKASAGTKTGDAVTKRTLQNIGVLIGSTAKYVSGFSEE